MYLPLFSFVVRIHFLSRQHRFSLSRKDASWVAVRASDLLKKVIFLKSPLYKSASFLGFVNLTPIAKAAYWTHPRIRTQKMMGVLLANAKNATELPGVDLSKLTPAQKKAAFRQLNEQKCTCGCDLTLAQCRINDTSCPVSAGLANQVVEKVLVP